MIFFFEVHSKLRREGSSAKINIMEEKNVHLIFNKGLSEDVENGNKKLRFEALF